MKFVLIPLLMLIFASLLGVTRLLGVVDFSGGDVLGTTFYNESSMYYDANGTLVVGENQTRVTTETAEVGMSAVISAGVLSLLISSVALGVCSGIHIFGSGLADISVEIFFKTTVYYGIWLLFSILAMTLFMEIPVFGLPLYFMLTFFYTLGIVGSI